MEAWRVRNFQKIHAEPFPSYRSPSSAEEDKLSKLYFRIFGTTAPTLRGLVGVMTRAAELNAAIEGFDLNEALPNSNARSDVEVAVKWLDTFDTVDIFRIESLVKYFDDIWYPGTDDIEIIDLDCKWIVAIEHGGYVYRWTGQSSPA